MMISSPPPPRFTAVGLLLLIAVLLRLLLLGSASLDFDEGASTFIAHGSLLEVLEHSRTLDMHPPVFHLLLAPVLQLTTQDWALRLVPCLAALIALALSVKIVATRWPGFAALWILGLLGANTFAIKEAVNLRMGSLAGLLVLTCLGIAMVAIDHSQSESPQANDEPRSLWKLAGLFALLAATAFYTFYLTLVPIGLIWAGALLLIWRESPKLRIPWALSLPLACIAFAPWIPVAMAQKARWAANLPPGVELGGTGSLISQAISGLLKFGVVLFSYGAPVPARVGAALLLLLVVYGTYHWGRQQNRHRELGLLWLPIVSLLLLVSAMKFTPFTLQERYLLMLIPLALLPTSILLSELRLTGTIAGVALLCLSLSGYPRLLQHRGPDFRSAGALLARSVQPTETVFVMSNYAFFPIAHYWPAGESQMMPLAVFDPAQLQDMQAINEVAMDTEAWLLLSKEGEWRNRALDRGAAALIEQLSLRFPQHEVTELEQVQIYRFHRASP